MGSYVFDDLVLPRKFLRMCRRNLRRTKIVDSSGMELTGGALLTATLALRRLLRREVLAADETHVGILLPPSVGAVLANAALTLDRRIAVNLNYTVTSEVINASMAQCGIRHVLTSRRMLERFPLKLDAELVYVEELQERLTWSDKLLAAAAAWLLPAAVLERLLGLTADPARRRGDGHVHFRLDRRAQGRDADLRQHRGEPATASTASSICAAATSCWACCRCSTPSATRSRFGRC